MHYQISDDCIIKSENAALTTKQPNKQIIDYILNLPNNLIALDYGCGRLRHSIHLYKKCSLLVAIDSNIQLERTQIIDNQNTCVIDYIKNQMPKAMAIEINDTNWVSRKYDFILCSNVLSAIPCIDDRIVIIENIKNNLKSEGKALISVQYRNSYFNSYKDNERATPYLDGWIIKRAGNNTFYGLIKPKDLIDMCRDRGLRVIGKKILDGSIYLEVCT